MSTILKALRRVEGEREQKVETRRLHAEVTSGTSSERRPLRGWIRLSLALSLLLVVAAGFWSWGSGPSQDETPSVVSDSEGVAPGLVAGAERIRLAQSENPAPPPSQRAPTEARVARTPPSPAPAAVPATAAAAGLETPSPPVASPESDKRRTAAFQEAIRRRSAAAEWAPRAPRYEPPRTFVPAPPAESPAPVSPEVMASSEPAPEEFSPYLAAREAARLKAEAEAEARTESIAMAQPEPISKPISKPTSKPMPTSKSTSKPISKPMPNTQTRAASAPAARTEPSAVGSLRVVSTVWHPTPEKRVAVVALSGDDAPVQLHQGESVNGLRVSEIKLSSVVFESGGQTIVRKVGAKP